MREDLEFGGRAAWLYRPEGATGDVPCVVLAHGFSLTRYDALPVYAEAFAAAGIAAFVFDYRGLGDSAGDDPQSFSIGRQRQDLHAAVGVARRLPGIDPERISLWGYSFGGGHAVREASRDPRIRAVVLLCPFLDGLARVAKTPPSDSARIMPRAIAQRVFKRPIRIPVTAPPGELGALTQPGEHESGQRMDWPDSTWQNEIAPGVLLTIGLFRPVRFASRLTQPVWVGLGERDITVSEQAVRRLAARAPHAELHPYDLDHFDPMVGDVPARVAAGQADFLRRVA